MHGGFATFATVIDVPFVARHATRDRARDVRAALGLPGDGRWRCRRSAATASATSTPIGSTASTTATVVITGQRRAGALAGRGVAFARRSATSTLRAFATRTSSPPCDVVVTKPGYGIIAECVANDTAMLYTSRGHFVEYDVHGPRDAALPALRVHRPAIAARRPLARRARRLLASPPPPERPRTDGAEVAADAILALLTVAC